MNVTRTGSADRPFVICHMASSLDGRIVPATWTPREAHSHDLYEALHSRLGGASWIVGRTTAQEFGRRDTYPPSSARFPRTNWLPRRGAPAYAFMIDAHGKVAWGRSEASGEPIVVILTEAVTDAHLAGLRRDGVGYIFAGKEEIDLAAMLVTIRQEFGIELLMLEGGGIINGAFLRAGLIDEISLMIIPAIDGNRGAPATFDAPTKAATALPPIRQLSLMAHEMLGQGIMWLRYAVHRPAEC